MAERPLYTLYKNLKAQNYDVPDDYNKFESALTRDGKGGADNRHAIYENLKAQNFDVPSTYERFYSALFEPRSRTSSRAKGGSVPMSAADRARFSAGAAAISASAQQTMNNADRYNRLKQRKQKQQKDFGRVNLGTHQTPFGGDANNVVKDDFAYNPETGKTGAYVTSDNENVYSLPEAEQKQAILDQQNNAYQQAVDTGEIPSVLDVRDKNGNYDLQENIGKNGTYLTEEGAQKQFDKKLADAYARKKEIEAAIAEDHRLHGNPLLSYGASIGASNGRTAEQSDYSNKLATSLALVNEQIGALEAVKQYPTSSWGEDALKALDNTAFTAKTWDFGLTDFATMGQMERIKTKMDNNIPLSGSDKMLLKSKLGADAATALEDEKMGNIYRWTKIAGQSLPFMADFFLTGGYGGITKGISRGALKIAAKRGMGKVSAAILKNTGIVAGDVIGSYAMAGTEQALKTGADIMQRHLGNLYQDEKGDYKFGTFDENGNLLHEGGESIGTALYKGMTSAMVENYTEKLFGHNYGIKKGAVNFMEKHGMNASAEFFKNIGKSGWYTNSKKWMEKFGINGFGEEVMEEEIGIPLHALLDGDNKFSDLLDTKQQLDIIGGMAISVGSMYAMGAGSRPVKGIYNRAQYYRFRNKVNVADSDAQNLMGDNWADIKDKIDNATNEQMGGVLADILRHRDTMTKEQINAAVNYGVNLMKMRGYNIAKTAEMNAREITNEPTTPEEKHQADIDNAYSEGHDADDADKHDIQIHQEDQMKTLAAVLGISEQQLSAMSDEELESMTGQDDKLDQAIYDYQLSSARYQGVVDDAQDKVDLAAHQAEQRVDMYTDQSRGSVRNATIKTSGGLEDYGVYIISGNIATHDDGSIDVSNSDDMILYYDPTTNSVEHADALMFAELGEELPADDVKAQAVADAKENAIKEVAGIIDGTVEVGSQFNVTDTDGTEHTYEVLADYGDGTAAISIDGNVVENPYSFADLQQMKDLEDQKRLETAKAEREQMEKERAAQQTQETEQTQPSFDFNQILNDNGNVVLVDVLDKDGNTKYPDSRLFLIRDAGAKAKVVELKSDGTLVPHAVNKEDVATISSMSLDEYKQAMPESSMIEDNSGENRGEIEVETPTIEGETAAPAEETAAPESAETPATEQTPAAPAITLEDGTIVPMLEDGNPDFSKLTAAQTAELYDTQFGEDADSIVSGYVSDAKKALDKASNMTVKGKTFVEQKAAKDAKEKAIADAQAAYDSAIAIRDAYNERQLAKVEDTAEGRKELIEKARRKFARLKSAVKDDAEAVSQLYRETIGSLLHRLYDSTGIDVTDTTPLTAEEYVASNLGAHSLNYEGTETSKGVKQETGLSREDFAKTQLLAADGKGTTIDALVHSLWENRPSNLESLDTQDIRNALIGVLNSGFKASEARNFVENIRIAQAENILEEQKRAQENAAYAEQHEAEPEAELKAKSDEKAELKAKSEAMLDNELDNKSNDLDNDLDNEKINDNINDNINTLTPEQQKAKEDGEKLGFPAVDNEGEPINQYIIELANWAKEQGLEIDPTSKWNNYADLFIMCKDGFGVGTLVPDRGESINQVVYFPDNVQGFDQLWKLHEEFNVGRDLKHSADMDNEQTQGATFYDADTAREFKEFVDKKVEEQNKVFGEQRSEEDLPFSAKENGKQQTTAERAADVDKNKVDDMKVVDNIVGEKTRKAFERLAKMMGADIQWQYSDKLGNGWIQETTDADGNVHRTIFITLDSSITEGAQFIFGHEMTHQIKNLNPAAYNELTQLVLDTYGSDAFDKAVDETMQRYSDAGFSGRARDYYAEEVVADSVGEMIRDLNIAQTLAMKMSHPLLAAIHEILQKIKLAFFGTEYSDVTKNIIRSIEQAYVKTAKGEVTNSETGEDVSFSLRQKPEPKKKGIGYKVFVLKDGKLYPPMVANPDGAATPVGVWLDADAAPIAGESKTGRPQVKQGGKGTQGGSGKLAYRPGWHLGVVPYAIQFNRKDAEGNKTLFPKNFVFAEVEYAADVDYQEEARQEGINPSGKYQHSLAGLKHLPTDGYYMYRTNPNPETDPWVITGAMKVNRILTRAEQADLVSKAGREPQQIQEGDIVTDDVVNSINQEIADAPKFSLKVYHGSGADFTEFDFDHMGEGAGSQVFGWGGYVTSSKKIGKSYATLMDNDPSKAYYRIQRSNGTRFAKKYPTLESFLHGDKQIAMNDKFTEQEKIDFYNEMKKLAEPYHNLYEVDIPEDNGSNYLDWDKPLSKKQQDAIREGLEHLGVDIKTLESKGQSLERTGENVYNSTLYIGLTGTEYDLPEKTKGISKFLSSVGFTGIKYKAGRNFGGAKKGDTNYVVFKPEDMRITEHTKFSLRLKSAIDETETNPSDAQKESGNYKKGHIKFGGYDYTIENPKGSTRSGKDADGKDWKVTMHDTYGYIRGKFGKDGDHLDMFINDKADLDNWNGDVFVVDQVNPDGSFDEHKVMYGYDSMDDAKKAYLANYSKGWQGLGNITGVSKDEFDKWLDTSNRKLKPFKDYAKVKFSLKDNQGNPLNQDGTLKLDKIKSVDELTDEDFTSAFRNVELPAIPKNVDAAIGANGKPVVIKKNIFEKNWNAHKFTPAESKKVLNDALYNTDLVGHTQPTKKPNHWVAIKLDEKSPITVLEVNDNKDNVEVVGWYTLDERNLGRIKRQAERNGGELIMLTPKDDKVESLSTPSLSSAAKIDNSSETTKENGEKFSLKDEKTLAGVHNISEEKLLKAIKQGGLANPSVAVIDSSKQDHKAYGGISLILPSDKIAKRTGKNAGTWQGDAYTPTYPQVERHISDKGSEQVNKDVLSVPKEMQHEVRNGIYRWLDGDANSGLKYLFLHEKGNAPKMAELQHKYSDKVYNDLKSITSGNFDISSIGKADAQKVLDMYIDNVFGGDRAAYEEKQKYRITRYKKQVAEGEKNPFLLARAKNALEQYDKYGFYFDKVQDFVRNVERDHRMTGFDTNATLNEVEDYIKTNNLTDEFNTWLEGKEKEYGVKEVIFDGFTPSGNRRYVSNTLENVSKIMKKQGRNGATGSAVSFQNFAARLMPSYGTLKDIRSKKGLLTSDREEFDKFRDKWSGVFYELGMKCQPDATGTFDDYGLARLSEAAMTSDPQAYLKKEYNVDFSDADTKRLKEMVKAIKEESPAMYFETKFERPVRFDEFSAAVVPTTTKKEVKEALKNAGVSIFEYDEKSDEDRSRAFNEAINSSDNIRFSLAGERGAAAADKAEERTTRMDNLSVARKMEEEKKDAKAIKMATGWERGADGKWRYEMPDAKIKDTMDVGGGQIVKRYEDDMLWNGGKLSDVIDAPELFKAYPQLKDVRIETDAIMNDMPSNGEYNSKTNTITIHADELKYMNGILNHEIQHAIQGIEGFATGGSPTTIRGEVKKRFNEVTKQIKQLRAEGKEDEAKALIEKNRGLYNAYMKNDDFNSYKSLAGEVEARNVSARLNMTPEERRKILAESTEDVARKDQIILGVGDVSFSLRDMADGKESGAADMAEDLKSLNTPDEVDDAIKTAIDDMPSGWQMANKKMIHIAQALGENRKAEIAGEEPKFSLKDGSLIKAGTYFSGGGLVEEGLKGIIDPVVAVEYDEKISGVYRNNFGQHIVTADVRDVDPKELVKQIDGEVEYFHASPVCKNYSQAKSNHAEVELDKETAASTAEFINAVKPKVVTIENVKGYKDSDAMKIITDALDANGYTWDADVYNAADYGGYTNRERLIVRAVRDGKLPEKPKKMAHKSGWYEAVADIIPTLTEKKNGVAPWMDIRLKADGIDWRNIDKPLYVMGSAYADGKVPHAFADELLPTLRTKSGDVIVMPDGKVYRAMGRVLARVSGVSDDYKMPFSENLSHTIIGNGIPTQLTEHVIAPLLTGSDPKFSIRTYHGTGASFDKFDLSHALEGEGSETFGHGVYVTNSSKIGREYAQRAKQRKMEDLYKNMRYPDGVKGDIFKRRVFGEMVNDVATGGSVASAKEFAKKRVGADANDIQRTLENLKDREKGTEYEQNLKDRLAEYKEGLKWIDSLDEDYLTQGNANRYDVDIPDDNGSNYLGWNESQNFPLEKWYRLWEITHEGFNENEYFKDGGARYDIDRIERITQMKLESPENGMQKLPTLKGEELYHALEDFFNRERPSYGAELASRALSEIGFVGIKYPAGLIHGGAEEGDYNYVIFDENNANIVGNTRFSLRYDQFEHDLNQWKKDNNLPKDAQRPTIPQRNAGESAVDFLRRVDEYRKQMALWKTAPTYEQHLLSDDTALGEFNRELQKGSVLKRIAFQDSMLAIRKAQEAIMKEVGVDRLNMAEDAYTAENRSHGKGKNEFEEYNNEFLQPLRKAYHQMKKILGDSYDNVRIYMMAKHGLERDAQMAFKKSLEADYEDVAQRSAAYKAYKGDMNRIINDSDLEFGRVDFNTWRQRDNALRAKYSPSYMDYRYDKNGIAYDYSGLSALFGGSDFEEAAHKLVRDIESSHVAEVQDLWNATNTATKKILRDGYKAGMMSKDTYQYVRDMYSHYIPLRGWDGTTADQVWDYIGGGKGAFNQTLKTAHGRTSIADDPIAYIENMAESGILLNNKNWVKQHLMLLAQNHPTSLLTLSKAWYVKSTDANGNEEWIPATPQITSQMDSNQVKTAIDAFEKKMEKMAQTGDATQKRDGLNIAYPQTHSEEREHEVRVMKDGEEYVIYVNGDPQLAQAMNNTRAHRVREIQSGKLDRAAAWLGRKMAAAYTSLSPLFIPSNYFRDLTMTLASTAIREDAKYNYLLRKNLATSWNLGFMLKDYQNGKLREKVSNGNATPKEQMLYDFMMNGGETGFVSSLDVEDLKKKFKNDLKDLDRWKANPVKVGHTIMDGIEFLNRAIEDSNRFAVYMTSIQYGRSIDEAVNDAKDVTLNFNRKGTGEYGWQMIRNLYLFINPAVQSLQTLGALAKHHPFKFTAVTASWLASGVLVPIVNAALMSLLGGDDDKDKYWQFTKWDRRNNLIMWVPFTHEYVKIPLAQEFRAFYGVGDMIASKMMGGELAEESWSQYAEDLLGQVVDMLPLDPTGYDGNIAVSLMPNAIRPVFELAFNVDFTGKPLFKETEYNKYDPNFTKAYVGTPDWLVRASKMVNSIGNDYPDVQQNSIDAFGDPRYNLNNPAVVDHVLSSYLGGAYTMGSQVLGVLTKSLNDPKEIKVADIPLVSKFVSNPDDRPVAKKQGDEFWDMKENHDRAANTLSKLKKQAKVDGDYSMLERFYGSEEYKQYKQDDVKVKKYEEDKKKERAEESGEEYRPHKLNAEDIYKAHATPKDDFEDLKLKQLYTKLNGFKTSYDLLVDTAPSQSEGYYKTNKAAIDAIDEISIDKQEISELKKGFLDDGKDAYNAEDMKQIRDLRKKVLAVLEKANKVVVANQKAKAEK
jgi:site-specific DNA-cytosine methylase